MWISFLRRLDSRNAVRQHDKGSLVSLRGLTFGVFGTFSRPNFLVSHSHVFHS